MKICSPGPTRARALLPLKPVSQRASAIASGPESPGRTRSPTISWSRPASATASASWSARPSLILCKLLAQNLEGTTVALDALAGNPSDHEPVEHRMASPLLAVVHVGDVDLHRRNPGQLEGIADRPAVVGPRAGVENGAVGALGQAMELLNVFP